MSIASQRTIPDDMRTCIIRIHSYRDKNPEGTLYNLYYGEEIAFANLTRLLLLMEDMMDEMGSPQASIHSRRFGSTLKTKERATTAQQQLPRPDKEVIATFHVKVLFRQGASWQGKIRWADAKEEQTFRSALELVKLMDSALPQPQVCLQDEPREAGGVG